jgi:hypothetical protein
MQRIRNSRLISKKNFSGDFGKNDECKLDWKAMGVVTLSLAPFFSPEITFHREKR